MCCHPLVLVGTPNPSQQWFWTCCGFTASALPPSRPPLQYWCASFADPGQRASRCRGWTCADDPHRVYRLRCRCPVCLSCPCVRCLSAVCNTSIANGVTSAFGSAPVKEVLSRRERSDFCLLAAHPSRRILSDAANGVISALGLPLPHGNSSITVSYPGPCIRSDPCLTAAHPISACQRSYAPQPCLSCSDVVRLDGIPP